MIFSDPAKIRHGSVNNALTFFQQIMAENDLRIHKILNGIEKPRPRDKIYQCLDDKIINALNDYDVVFFY